MFHQDISQIENSTEENGVQICWLTTFGVLEGKHQQTKITDKFDEVSV